MLKPLSEYPLQAYFDNRTQLTDIIGDILQQSGKANLYISTFSTSEEFLRRLYRIRKQGTIERAFLLTDMKAAQKTLILRTFMMSVFDEICLAENHSKVILIDGSALKVDVVTSQNQTRGNRLESGIVTCDTAVFRQLLEQFNHIRKENEILVKQ